MTLDTAPAPLDSADGGSLLRIEQVIPALDLAGAEMVIVNLVRRLARRGHDVGVTCIERRGQLGEQLIAEGFRVSLVPTPGVLTNFRPRALAGWFRERAPDVVHVHGGAWLKTAQAARASRTPTIYTMHGIWPDRPWFHPYYSRYAKSMTRTVITVTDVLREHLIADLGMPADDIVVIPNGIDTDRFRPGPRSGVLREPLGIPADVVVIGTVARLHPVKNQKLLVEAFARVHAQRSATALVFVGEGPLRDELAAQAQTLGVGHAVHFTGATDDAPAVYRDFDVFCLSSITEGTSISALEAMASGRHVVLTAVGGNPRLLQEGAFGRLVSPPDQPAALVEALLDAVDDAALRERSGSLARAAVLERYSLELSVERHVETYRRDLHHSGRRNRA